MRTEYHPLQKLFHWLMATMIIGLLAVGYIMHGMETSPQKFELYALHKATGAVLLALVAVRLLARFGLGVPPLPDHMPAWQRHAANMSHWALYVLMIAMPLSGWMMSSASGFPVSVYGLFVLPDLIGPNHDVAEFLEETHELLAVAIIAIASVHALAGLFHHFVQKDNVLRRMLPGAKPIPAVAVAAALFLVSTASQAGNAPEWKLDRSHSAIAFIAKVNKAPLKGNFEKFTTTIRFDPDNLEGSLVQVRVDMASITMVNKEAVSVARGPDWLAIQAHPEAVFQSTKFNKTGRNEYEVEGNLWIKSKKVPLTLKVDVNSLDEEEAEIEGETKINRKDFTIGQGQWGETATVGDDVLIRFVVRATK